ncbi:carboxypeptidase-like regulatory domain-containing protein [Reichenbachiella versicolor]|uniref:carboxypeptidase-like regulatory domain-containing protein n=1 Tax=Reichenbachiella versicolor TaxID=1821036 RepID=UPI000D6DCC5E|nr:carboxypeptidase-like regulatory domain-containing protein [Reichenbachiella versicolor]
MKNLIFTLTSLTFIYSNISAQSIGGSVMDSLTNEPLPFASISVKGTGKGTVTNIDGDFLIDISKLSNSDIISISYIGYQSQNFTPKTLINNPNVKLSAAAVSLEEIIVSADKELSAKEIIEEVKDNYDKNYPNPTQKMKFFFHKFEQTPFTDKNKMTVKESDFIGLDEENVKTIFDKIPDPMTEFIEAQSDLYRRDDDFKLLVKNGISLEEGSMEKLYDELEPIMEDFLNDIKTTNKSSEEYYQIRSGLLAFKYGKNGIGDDTWKLQDENPDSYVLRSKFLTIDISKLLLDNSTLKGDNWEMINSPNKYNYKLDRATIMGDDIVYQISFIPKKSGIFEGTVYVSTETFAILQISYKYAKGKQSEKINLLGVNHAMKNETATVIFEKGEDGGYYFKYASLNYKEYVGLDRPISITKKRKRFLFDKSLNQIKARLELEFEPETNWEFLVQERSLITSEKFESTQHRKHVLFKRHFSYSPDIWSEGTVLTPSSELKEYKRSK